MLTLRSLAAHLSLIPASGNMIMHRLSIPGVIHQPGVTSLFGSKGPLPGPAVTLSRQLHRQTPDVEVDLLQLDGEDSGKTVHNCTLYYHPVCLSEMGIY